MVGWLGGWGGLLRCVTLLLPGLYAVRDGVAGRVWVDDGAHVATGALLEDVDDWYECLEFFWCQEKADLIGVL